jgi:hypothetical protein
MIADMENFADCKATWPRFAEEWVKLADEAEQSAWREPPSASATRGE